MITKKTQKSVSPSLKKPSVSIKKSPSSTTSKKKKSYPILSDDGENYNGPKVGPREKTIGGGFSKNGSMIKKAKSGMTACKYGCK